MATRTPADGTRPLLVPVPDAQNQLGGISRTTLYELINAGELVRVNVGRRSFVTSESIAAYVNKLSKA